MRGRSWKAARVRGATGPSGPGAGLGGVWRAGYQAVPVLCPLQQPHTVPVMPAPCGHQLPALASATAGTRHILAKSLGHKGARTGSRRPLWSGNSRGTGQWCPAVGPQPRHSSTALARSRDRHGMARHSTPWHITARHTGWVRLSWGVAGRGASHQLEGLCSRYRVISLSIYLVRLLIFSCKGKGEKGEFLICKLISLISSN